MLLILFISLFLNSYNVRAQAPLSCEVKETQINLLQNEKFNPQLSRDNCYEAICRGTKTLSDFQEELAEKRKTSLTIPLDTKKIHDAVIANFKQLQKIAPELEKSLQSKNFQKVRPEDKLTINLDWFLNKQYLLDKNERIQLAQITDNAKLKEAYYDITEERAGPNEIKWMLRMYKNKRLHKLLKTFQLDKSWYDRESTLKTAKSYFPLHTNNQEIKEFIDFNISRIKNLADENKTHFKQLLKSPIINRLKSGQYINGDLDYLNEQINYIGLIETLYNEPEISRLIQDRETSNGLTYKNKANLKKLLSIIPKADLTKVSKNITKALKYCSEALKVSLKSAVPTKQHIQNTVRLKQAKKNLKKAFFNSYSTGSAIMISQKIDAISFEIPPSKESVLKQIKQMNKSLITPSNFVTAKDAHEQKYNIAKAIESFSDFPDISNEETLEGATELAASRVEKKCWGISRRNSDNAPISTTIDDHTSTSINYVKVSPFTFNNLDQNMGIVYHELGHNIDIFMRSGTKRVSKDSSKIHHAKIACLKNQTNVFNSDEIKDEKVWNKVSKIDFSGEDFSDLVGAAFYKKANLACALTSKLGNAKLRQDYNFLAPNHLEDNHSNAFYRILNIEKTRNGSLPKQCSDYLQNHANGLKLKDCLK